MLINYSFICVISRKINLLQPSSVQQTLTVSITADVPWAVTLSASAAQATLAATVVSSDLL